MLTSASNVIHIYSRQTSHNFLHLHTYFSKLTHQHNYILIYLRFNIITLQYIYVFNVVTS
jgi:hypothetical protein